MIAALLSVLACTAPAVLAQGPGAGQVNGGNQQTTGSVYTGELPTTVVFVGGPSATASVKNGPWQDIEHLEGTWSSKSMMVMTGPDFYDPVDELLIEPALPGISFSFTKDGFWEQAMYQVTAEPTDPTCATGALTFQHGTYNASGGKLTLTPFEDDGRQLVSDPCNQSKNSSEYVQYSQQLSFSKFEVWVDLYYGRYRLDLFQFDGTPMAHMYLVYRPPQMLPTVTMNPGAAAAANASLNTNSKRGVDDSVRERIKRSLINRSRTSATRVPEHSRLHNTLWYGGVTLMVAGAAGWLYLA